MLVWDAVRSEGFSCARGTGVVALGRTGWHHTGTAVQEGAEPHVALGAPLAGAWQLLWTPIPFKASFACSPPRLPRSFASRSVPFPPPHGVRQPPGRGDPPLPASGTSHQLTLQQGSAWVCYTKKSPIPAASSPQPVRFWGGQHPRGAGMSSVCSSLPSPEPTPPLML